jgi:hypothetical protein
MWITCMIGIAQKWVSSHMLDFQSEIASDASVTQVVRSHSVKWYNKSPIRSSLPLSLAGRWPVAARTVTKSGSLAELITVTRAGYAPLQGILGRETR